MVRWSLTIFLTVMNLAAFVAFGIDKKIARSNALRSDGGQARRISEKALFLWALCGGALGAFLGMKFWHHKTKHWYFQWGLPAILGAHLLLAGFLWGKF